MSVPSTLPPVGRPDHQTPVRDRHLTAYEFKAETTLKALGKFLEERTNQRWFPGSKAFIGDCITMQDRLTKTVIRVFQLEIGFAFDMLNKDNGQTKASFEDEVLHFKTLLEEAHAKDFSLTENFY